jgi:hypothetical protein
MAPKPLVVLRKGLARFKETIKTRKKELDARLARSETISSSDECWLDNEANTVDEQRVLDTLESASDCERGLERLDEGGKAIVKKLREWAGDLAKIAGNKRKRTIFFLPGKSKWLMPTCVKVPRTRKSLKYLRKNQLSRLPLRPLHAKKMLHWLSALKSLIGTTKTGKTNQGRCGISIRSTRTLRLNSCWCQHGSKKKLDGVNFGNRQTTNTIELPSVLDRLSIPKLLR